MQMVMLLEIDMMWVKRLEKFAETQKGERIDTWKQH